MGRNYLWHRQGDAINAVLAAAGYNFRRLIRWLELLLSQILIQLSISISARPRLESTFFTDDGLGFGFFRPRSGCVSGFEGSDTFHVAFKA
jgi:hypothetical protein